jgi:two-component system response regulator AtoC
VAAGNFRQDLYFRLNGVTFVVPPLRTRVAEIAPLAERFLAAASRTLDRTSALRLSPDALRYLEAHAWPGNVRELRNVIERAAVLATGDVIVPADLPGNVTRLTGAIAAHGAGSTPPTRAPTQRQQIIDALDQCAGNQTRAAKLLGISLRTLVNRLAEHDIPRPRK